MIKIILVEDQKMVLAGIEMLLKYQDGISVIGAVPSAEEAIPLLEKNEIDVALVDIRLPGMSGVDLTEHIKNKYPEIGVLIISAHKQASFIDQLMKVGADGYILKHSDQDELTFAIKQVAKRKTYYDQEVIEEHIRGIKDKNPDPVLTSNEIEVLRLIAQGYTTPQISAMISRAKSTVDTHRRTLISKLGLKNSFDLVRYAIENGYLDKT